MLHQRYVDDILISANEQEIDIITKKFNNVHPRLKFTIEKGNNQNSINFLDLILIRNKNGSIETNWHR